MAEITGKTIYIFGAGASRHTGAPLLGDFLVTSRLLLEQEKEPPDEKSKPFMNVFQWIDRLRSSTYYVDFDLDNLEHIFSLAEMKKQLGSAEGKTLFSHLQYIVMQTLDNNCKLKWNEQKKNFDPDNIYSNFVKKLEELNSTRRKQAPDGNNFKNDVMITFNYDVMLDNALYMNKKLKYNYCFNSKPNSDEFSILKLHGSTNWAACFSNNCKGKQGLIHELDPIPSRIPPIVRDKEKVPFNMVTCIENKKCESCGNSLNPVVIPPTWSKTISGTVLPKIWNSAVEEIEDAFQVIIIGYSLPPTDTFFQYLMTLGLTSNPNLHRVVIVNNDTSDDFKNRYENVFSRSLKNRGRLIFLEGKFEDFVEKDMPNIGKKIELKGYKPFVP